MECTINKDGNLTIRAETELEAYALSQWVNTPEDKKNITYDWSLREVTNYPERQDA